MAVHSTDNNNYRWCVTLVIVGWLGRAMGLGSFQCRGVLLLWNMVGQGPAVLAAGAGWAGYCLLAHLSRRLTRWAYRMGLEPASVRASTLSNMNISETSRPITTKFYLKHHWGGGKAALGFDADQIRTLVSMATDSSHRVIMGEKGVITFSRLFLIGSFLYLQVTMTYIRACMSSKFGRIRPRTTELAALERQKKFL